MSFFATKSRIAVATFKNVVGDGVFPPSPFTGTYWLAYFITMPGYAGEFGDVSKGNNLGSSIFLDEAENVYISGVGDVAKITPLLILDWVNSIGGIDVENRFGQSGAVDASGNVYYCGKYWPDVYGTAPIRAFLNKHSSSGALLWSKNIGSNLDFDNWPNLYCSVHCEPTTGNVIVCGQLGSPPVPFETPYAAEYNIVKYDPNGNILWQKVIENPLYTALAASPYEAYAMGGGFDNENNFYVTLSNDNFDSKLTLIKMDTSGNFIWIKEIDVPATITDLRADLTYTDQSGKTYIGLGGGSNTTLLCLDKDGNLLWKKRFLQNIGGVVVDSSGNIILNGSGGVIIKLNSSGNLIKAVYTNIDFPFSGFTSGGITLDSDDNIYAVWGLLLNNYETDKYDSGFIAVKVPNSLSIDVGTYTIEGYPFSFVEYDPGITTASPNFVVSSGTANPGHLSQVYYSAVPLTLDTNKTIYRTEL